MCVRVNLPGTKKMTFLHQITMQATDWLHLFGHFLMLSMMSVGGAISTLPEMHRFLVVQQNWLTDSQFNASVAIAQAAPGPNVLFIALMGWNIGLNAGSNLLGLLGVLVTMSGILLPSTTLTYLASSWLYVNRHLRAVRAFKQGLAPIVVALLLSTGWIMASATHEMSDWPLWLTTAVSVVIISKTRLPMLWLLAAGALAGWFGAY